MRKLIFHSVFKCASFRFHINEGQSLRRIISAISSSGPSQQQHLRHLLTSSCFLECVTMSSARQIGLIPAGSQPWNQDICAASGDRFAYCATLAVYIYQMDPKLHDFKLHSIMAEHKKTISTISWSPYDPDLIATASITNRIIIWNVSEQKTVARLDVATGTPRSIGWGVPDKHWVGFMSCRGPMQMWNFTAGGQTVVGHKEVQNFASDVCQFRCHPLNPEKIAIGHMDGSISFLCPGHGIAKHVVKVSGGGDDEASDDCRVISLEWDPLGLDCVVCITASDGIALVDSTSRRVVMRFQLPSAAMSVCCLSWIHSAPGMFITGDANSGVLRLWNVSKATPIESIRINKTGFHSSYVIICPTTTTKTTMADDEPSANGGDSPTKVSESQSVSASSQFAIPSARVLCLFMDGGVGLYDLRRRRWNFLREKGHIETIFDCKFSPEDPDLLATASFDGTIKVWDIRTLKAISTSAGNEGVIYSLSWGPSDTQCIAASTSRHGAFIWDTRKAKVVNRFSEHKPGANIYTIAWNQKDVRRIATAGSDCLCVVCHMDGKLIIKYSHPMAVFGCDWSPHNGDIIATGCEDKNVRIFYLATNSENPVKTYSGHTAKVFHVRWSPLREGILVSGSDDGTIRMWDYTQDSCIRLFQGHTGPVRGLVWNPEIPYLLISGSWDYTIRIWDTRDGACVDRILDHGADVYGLSCHPKRPFVLASCSRDSTIRLWSIASLAQPLQINVLAGRPWDEVLISPVTGKEHAMSLGTPPLLAGKCSRDIKLDLERCSGDAFKKSIALFSEFFGKPEGCANLWQLVSVSLRQDTDVLASASYRKSIVHSTHVVSLKAAEAQELEMVRLSKFGCGLGAPSRDDRLREAAALHLKLGNTRRYCQLLIELGEWDRALAVAPSVSLGYWKNLMLRRTKSLITDDSSDALPYAVASRQLRLLVDFLTTRGQHQDAHLVAAAAAEEREQEEDEDDEESDEVRTSAARSNRTLKTRETEADKTIENSETVIGKSGGLLEQTTCHLADWYFRNGSPILAACCHMSVDDHQGAMSKLIRASELELAAAVGQVLGTTQTSLRMAVELLARRCERIGCWELGVRILRRFPGTDLALAKLCARCAAPMSEINDLHRIAGLPTMEECGVKAEELRSAGDNHKEKESSVQLNCVMYYMLSTTPEMGLELGINTVKDRMSRSRWKVDDVFEMLQLVAAMQTERLQKQTAKMSELLVLCTYVGALVAIRRQYDSIVIPLFKHALSLLKRDHLDNEGRLPVNQSLVSREMTTWEATHVCGKDRGSLKIAEQQSSYDDLMRKLEETTSSSSSPSPIEVGPDVVLGSSLPNHSDVNVSCLNGQRIQGPVFFLEDGFSALSLSDAFMWAKVNPFSPLGSGMRINPF